MATIWELFTECPGIMSTTWTAFQDGRHKIILNMLARDKDQLNLEEVGAFVSNVLQTMAFHDWAENAYW